MTTERISAADQVLHAIRVYSERPYGPTRREIQGITGLPLGTIQEVVKRLADEGKIHYVEKVARSIRIKE